jgi:nicotinamide riboside kinase
MIKIAIIGTHGTGKTTTVNAVYNNLKNQGKSIDIVRESFRETMKAFDINKDGQTEQSIAQLYHSSFSGIAEERLKSTFNNIICDRTPFDSCVYTTYYKNCEGEELEKVKRFLADYVINFYDYIFLINPSDRPLTEDGVRLTDKKQQLEVHDVFTRMLKEYDIANRVMLIYQEDQLKNIERITKLFN